MWNEAQQYHQSSKDKHTEWFKEARSDPGADFFSVQTVDSCSLPVTVGSGEFNPNQSLYAA